ncbi:MAG: phosphoribosylformylglycinamidine cyclo-ligase [Candidatus Omnitrophica bacterium]|nr:phosphoribosylformylglycinamidine cyclo-ligase [Candidatus Omnitrophota bacterium]
MTYKSAGVDIEKANNLITDIRKLVNTTRVRGSMDSIGGFGGFFDPMKYGIKDPLIVASTDGVGTKLKLAIDSGKHDTVGIDLVAMSVNDVICTGARPLFFLDYFASGKLDGKIWTGVLKGIIKGCRESGCALLGGETAEMPGMYMKGDYDLAGFAVGVVDRKKVVDGKGTTPGDVIVGISSSGLHSNGYSLIRKLFSKKELNANIDLFLEPTKLYVKPVLEVLSKARVRGIAHITGGGFIDNIPRVLPDERGVEIYKGTWRMPKVFELVIKKSGLPDGELYRTLNMGIGMVLVMPASDAEKAMKVLSKHRLESRVIGKVVKGRREVRIVDKEL